MFSKLFSRFRIFTIIAMLAMAIILQTESLMGAQLKIQPTMPMILDAPYSLEMTGIDSAETWQPIIIDAPYILQMTGVGAVEAWQPIVIEAPYRLEMTGQDSN